MYKQQRDDNELVGGGGEHNRKSDRGIQGDVTLPHLRRKWGAMDHDKKKSHRE
jgi:hypothetical protein